MKYQGKGGANTKTGLVFEGRTDLATFLNSQKNYLVENNQVFYEFNIQMQGKNETVFFKI